MAKHYTRDELFGQIRGGAGKVTLPLEYFHELWFRQTVEECLEKVEVPTGCILETMLERVEFRDEFIMSWRVRQKSLAEIMRGGTYG